MKCEIFQGDEEKFAVALAIRQKVFVEEQGVPIDIERDEFDTCATHLLLFSDGMVVGTGRIFADSQDGQVCRLGRVAVIEELRGRGLGKEICVRLIELARSQGFAAVLIHAQTHVEGFYKKLGFNRRSEVFFEAGIEHVEMSLNLG